MRILIILKLKNDLDIILLTFKLITLLVKEILILFAKNYVVQEKLSNFVRMCVCVCVCVYYL